MVNGKVMNIPSATVKVGDVVSVREKSKSMETISNSVAGSVNKHSWLDFDASSLTGRIISIPDRSQIPENIKEQLIVELYSK